MFFVGFLLVVAMAVSYSVFRYIVAYD